jgi:hypothetical protein
MKVQVTRVYEVTLPDDEKEYNELVDIIVEEDDSMQGDRDNRLMVAEWLTYQCDVGNEDFPNVRNKLATAYMTDSSPKEMQ